jgi:hypothetical protein
MKRRKFITLLGGWACLRLTRRPQMSQRGSPLLGVEEADRFIFVPSGYGSLPPAQKVPIRFAL